MLPFVSAMLPFMSAMLPFLSAMLPFMCAMLPFLYSDSDMHLLSVVMSYSTHPGHCDCEKHPSRALTPMTHYLITACVDSGNSWRCLYT